MLPGKNDAHADHARPLIKPVRTSTATAVWGIKIPKRSRVVPNMSSTNWLCLRDVELNFTQM